VTRSKHNAPLFAARHYLLKLRQTPPCRFDVIAVEGDDLQWFKAAFDA
jgi:putative endonuclease